QRRIDRDVLARGGRVGDRGRDALHFEPGRAAIDADLEGQARRSPCSGHGDAGQHELAKRHRAGKRLAVRDRDLDRVDADGHGGMSLRVGYSGSKSLPMNEISMRPSSRWRRTPAMTPRGVTSPTCGMLDVTAGPSTSAAWLTASVGW